MPEVSDIYPSLTYADAAAAIEFLCRAFGFERRLVVPRDDGGVLHSELSLGTSVVMVSSPRPEDGRRPPGELGGLTCTLSLWIDDPDGHCARARAAGAKVVRDLADEEYGGRGSVAADPEGHLWYFGTYRPGGWWDGASGGS